MALKVNITAQQAVNLTNQSLITTKSKPKQLWQNQLELIEILIAYEAGIRNNNAYYPGELYPAVEKTLTEAGYTIQYGWGQTNIVW